MRRLIIGMCLIGNLIINVAMLVTTTVLLLLRSKFELQFEFTVSITTLICSCILSLILAVWFRRLSKKSGVLPKLRGLFKAFADELRHIDIMYSCYIDSENDTEFEELVKTGKRPNEEKDTQNHDL